MSVSVTVNNTTYTIPQTNESGWDTQVTAWIQAVSSSTLQKSGGTFTLTADLDFGASFGVKSLYYKSRNTNPASTGIIRLGSAESIVWRNNANSGDLPLTTDASDNLLYDGSIISSSAGVVPVAAGGTGITSYTTGDTLYASGATTLSKRAIGSTGQVLVVAGGLPTWGVGLIAGGSTGVSSYTTGDVLYYDSGTSTTALQKLAIGTTGQPITVVAGKPSYAGTVVAPSGGTGQSSYTTGDILYASSSSALSKLGIGSNGNYLSIAGGIPSWTASTNANLGVKTKTANYTLLGTDDIIVADNTGGGFTLTLPDCASNSGHSFRILIKSSSGSQVGVARAGSDTINNQAASYPLTSQNDVTTIFSTGGTDWQVMSQCRNNYILVSTGNGYGSTTGTKWRRWTTTVASAGSDITYADSGTAGGSFTIVQSGMYGIVRSDFAAGAGQLGLSLNSSQGTTNITSATSSTILGITNNPAASVLAQVSAFLHLSVGDVVRGHDAGDMTCADATCRFLIVRLA